MRLVHLVAAVVATIGFPAFAQAGSPDHAAHHAPAASVAPATTTEGEVRKIDKAQGKVTLRHGPIENLEMPAMTMVFKAADPRLLDGITEGDKVKFSADRVDGVLTVTAIEIAK